MAFQRKTLGAALALALVGASSAHAQTEIQWWHSMTGALGERVSEFANGFNESQKAYKVVPVYKGSYPESMTAANSPWAFSASLSLCCSITSSLSRSSASRVS